MANGDAGGFTAFMATMEGDMLQPVATEPKDEYQYEEQQERKAMMKSYHHPMKQWFRQRPKLEVHSRDRAFSGSSHDDRNDFCVFVLLH